MEQRSKVIKREMGGKVCDSKNYKVEGFAKIKG